MQTKIIYANFKGGIISPGYLKQLLEVAATAGVGAVRFGLRQQLIMEMPVDKIPAFTTACVKHGLSFAEAASALPNIVSSYAGANIFTSESWLSEGHYKDVFDLFNYQPFLKVNICDSKQTFTPLLTGHLNWVSSNQQHFWYLYIRFPGTDKVFCWPELVYTNDLASVSKELERLLIFSPDLPHFQKLTDLTTLVAFLKNSITYIALPVKEELQFPAFHLPYYEGLNKDRAHYWLGIYRRDEIFSLAFLIELCKICLDSKIGEIYATAWKTLIIKGIDPSSRRLWDYLLGKYRINVRHAANELNWQVEDRSEDGLILKRHVIRYFDKEDVRTYGLCFAVNTLSASQMFGSVMIRRRNKNSLGRSKSQERFDILFKKDFNPNESELLLFRENVEKDHLGVYLVSLCKFYYEQERPEEKIKTTISLSNEKPDMQVAVMTTHQCKACLSTYEMRYGDAAQNIPAGTAFSALPEDYECALCGNSKMAFVETVAH